MKLMPELIAIKTATLRARLAGIPAIATLLFVTIASASATPVCQPLELSTAPFTKGVALAAADALPEQGLAHQRILVYARRTAGAGCQPPAAYQGNTNPLELSFTFKYDLPETGSLKLSLNNINSIPAQKHSIENRYFLGDDESGILTLDASDGISKPFNVTYNDAGRIELVVVDTAEPAVVVSEKISWFPSTLVIEEVYPTGQPDFSPSDANPLVAGQSFTVVASARTRFGGRMANFGPDAEGGPGGDGEQLILRSNLLAPTFAEGGRNGRVENNPATGGVLVNGTGWRPFLENGQRSGKLIGEGFVFNEVGRIQLSVGLAPQQNEANQSSSALNNPLPSDGQYFAGKVLDVAVHPTELRFVPASFGASTGVTPTDVQANLPQFATGCALPAPLADDENDLQGGFTYAGDWLTYAPGRSPTVVVTPLAADGLPVTNYIGEFRRLTQQSLNGRAYSAAVGQLVQSGLTADPAGTPDDPDDDIAQDLNIESNQDGTITIQARLTRNDVAAADARLLTFARDPAAPLVPFDADISLTIPLVDEDGVTTSDNLPIVFGAAEPGNGIAFSADDMVAAAYTGRQIRHGQLKLGSNSGNTTPDENAPTTFVKLPLSVEYFASDGFRPHTWDNCSVVGKDDVVVVEALGRGGEGRFQPQNQFADPDGNGRGALDDAPMVMGDALLLYYSGLAGIAQIEYDFDAVPAPSLLHLQPADANTQGQLSFGLYAGDTRIAYRSFHSRGVN